MDQATLSGEQPEHSPGQKYGIYEVTSGGFSEYQAGHIPGAFHFDLSVIENPLSWNFSPDDELLAFLSKQGITSDSAIILSSKNLLAAARAALLLMYVGVEDVRILDGGFYAWVKAGYPVETGVNEPVPGKAFGRNFPGHPEHIIGIDAVKAFLDNDQGILVSVRSWTEYIGETSGYDFTGPKGRIAGAI